MADPEMDDDLFADLYDGDDTAPEPAIAEDPELLQSELQTDNAVKQEQTTNSEYANDSALAVSAANGVHNGATKQEGGEGMQDVMYPGQQNGFNDSHEEDYDRPIGIKEDGKMFIGGLNWETTDQSLKDYFTQFGEVLECTVMRDGASGRSRGFGFLTFRDPKCVNTVMVKEHYLDGKIIDPKRAIPRDEQERTSKIFVGGVSQEATEQDFKDFFAQFGRVLDATLMMDKDTGRPRGFGFVTFDSEAAVDRTLEGPLEIKNKMIEVKKAQPRGNMRDEDDGQRGRFNRKNDRFGGGGGGGSNDFSNQQNQVPGAGAGAQAGGTNNMSPAMMAQYWQRMQLYFQAMQQNMAMSMQGGGMQGNPAMMQQMMAMRQQGMNGMNPQMMQQMQQAQMGGDYPGIPNSVSPMNGAPGNRPGYTAQEQLMFEQQKYERQQQRMGGGGGGPGSFSQGGSASWDGMYDDVPPPANMAGQGGQVRGGFGGRGRGNRGSQPLTPTPQPVNAPAGAPTGPKNAGRPGANYRGGGRGGRQHHHPYARGGGN